MEDLIEGVDYYMDDNGRYVFTEEFLLRMGTIRVMSDG